MHPCHLLTALVLCAAVVGLAACSEGEAPENESPEARLMALGRQTYRRTCITCHQADGRGIPGTYPPLRETAWTEGDPGRLIRLVLDGMHGPIEVKGKTYDQIMTPLGYLTDEQIAAVLTFVRQHFGNEAGPVTPEQVAAVRAADEHEGLWTPDVLWERTDIPGDSTAGTFSYQPTEYERW